MPQQKRYIKKKINGKAYFAFYLYMLFVLLSLFAVASYTWFSLSRTVPVNNMNVYITNASGLELAPKLERKYEDTKWSQKLVFAEMVPSVIFQNQVLRPVTWSDQDQCFYAATYGSDGRVKGFGQRLNDNDSYIKTTYYARTGQPVSVKLKEVESLNVSTNINFSSPADLKLGGSFMMAIPGFSWEEIQETLLGGPKGHAEKAVRIGFRITYVDTAGQSLSKRGPMIIFEPNCDVHVDRSRGYVPTPSIDGTPTLVGSQYDAEGNRNSRLILQNATTLGFNQEDTSQAEIIIGTFENNPTLFHLNPDEIAKIEMYVWLEGQDVDCTNASVFALNNLSDIWDDHWLVGNIQFEGSTEGQSGMVPIELE